MENTAGAIGSGGTSVANRLARRSWLGRATQVGIGVLGAAIGARTLTAGNGETGMWDRVQDGALVVATIGSGVVAGVLFAFSTSIMRSLADAQHPHGLIAMQRINVVIQNPLFLTLFMGTAAASAVAVVQSATNWGDAGSGWLLAGGVLYIVGTFGMTAVLHVPWNDALAKVDPAAADSAAAWTRYVDRWTAWNHVRTIAAVASAVCLLVAQRAGA